MTVESFLEGHVRAFEWLGGVPRECVYDNLRSAVAMRERVDGGRDVSGDVPNVVFPCGLVHHPEDDRLFLYYGAADTRIALATASCSEVLEYLMACPPG